MSVLTDRPARPLKGRTPPAVPAGVKGRRRRPVWAVVGALVVVGAMLGFGIWSSSLGSRREVLVAAREVPAGRVVGERDVRTARIGTSDAVATVPATQRSLVVGRTAKTTIPSGALISRDQVTSGSALTRGRALVGVVLGPGAVPAGGVRPGDRVEVVSAPTGASATGTGESGTAVAVAVVSSVEPVPVSASSSGGVSVALEVDQPDAVGVATAAGSGRVRLVVLPPTGPVDVMNPPASKAPAAGERRGG